MANIQAPIVAARVYYFVNIGTAPDFFYFSVL